MLSPTKYPQLINLSLPKTSSSSLADYCNQFCFATHEAWHTEITKAIVKYYIGKYPNDSLRNFYLFRNIFFQHDVDSATFNHFFMNDLYDLFPSSAFICIFRDVCSWVASMLNMWSSFNSVHQARLAQNDQSISKNSREWANWINQYSTLYSPHLSIYFPRRSNFDLNSNYLKRLSIELLEFWIQYSESIILFSSICPSLYTISMKNIDQIPSLLEDQFPDQPFPKANSYPRSNSYPLVKQSDFYISPNDVSSFVPDSLLKKASISYERLSILERNHQ